MEFRSRSSDPYVLDFIREYWQHPKRKVSLLYKENNLLFVRIVSKLPTLEKIRVSEVTFHALNRLNDALETSGRTPRMVNLIMQAVKVPSASLILVGSSCETRC